jgi:uncharacterized glyoxalase superfamily protein PhnB
MDRLAEFIGVEAPDEGRFGGFTLGHRVGEKEDVAALLSLAANAGARIVKSASRVFWGGHSGIFADPDGYLWEVFWSPSPEADTVDPSIS